MDLWTVMWLWGKQASFSYFRYILYTHLNYSISYRLRIPVRHSFSLHTEDQQAHASSLSYPRKDLQQSLQTSHCCSKNHLPLNYPNAPKPTNLISQPRWPAPPACLQECRTCSVCLFPSRNTVYSSLKEEDISLLCEPWCRYLRFSTVPGIKGYFPHQPHPLSYPVNSQQQVIYWLGTNCPFIYSRVKLKKRQRPLQADFPSSAETLSSLMPNIRLEILACLLHICCTTVLKARDGTGKINRWWEKTSYKQ